MTRDFAHFLPFAALCTLGSLLLACSSNEPESPAWSPSAGGADAEAGAGAGGEISSPAEGGEAPTASCTSDADCDDGQACNGVEACAAGSCVAGEPLECAEHLACVETDGGSCVFTDESPWVIYTADDDTVAQTEIYAIKRDLIGKMTPIKLNGELEPGADVTWYTWSPDHRVLAITVSNGELPEVTEFVSFGAGVPRWISRVEGNSVSWSKSSQRVAVFSPTGVALYEYTRDGSVSPLFSWAGPSASYPYGDWSNTGALLFATQVTTNTAAHLYETFQEQGEWTARVVEEATNLSWFVASPSQPEIVFGLTDPESGDFHMYALANAPGSEPKSLASDRDSSVAWSPDGSQYLLLIGQPSGTRTVLLGEGSVLAGRTMKLAPTASISWARFAPDGRQVLLYEPVQDWGQDVKRLDPMVRADIPVQSITRMGLDDELALEFGADLVVAHARDTADSKARLTLSTLDGNRKQLDEPGPGEQISYLQVSPHGYFASYAKGAASNLRGYYVDLRYGSSLGYKPVRLPGEGKVDTSYFDAAGTSLYYLLERDNGARECWHIDLSGQTAAEPVKVSREGRVLFCGTEL